MSRFINPFTDVGFKRIFGQEVNKDLLIDFLNDLLEGERCIKDIKFLDKEILPEAAENRSCIYDIFCTNEDGEHFIVEMQNRSQSYFKERAIYYLSRAIVRQGEKGVEWKFNLKAVYGVFFTNFYLTGSEGKLRTDVALCDTATNEQFSDKLRFIFLELPAFHKEESQCENDFERWIYVLKNMEKLQRMPFKTRNAVFKKLEEIGELSALSKEDRIKYDASIRVYRDNLATEEFSIQQGLAKGLAQGLEQGIKQGIKQGLEQGLQQGLQQGLEQGLEQGRGEERVRNAKAMLEYGLTIDQISKMLNLTDAERDKLMSDN